MTRKTFYIGVQPISNVVVVLGEQQRDSATHINVSILPQTPLSSRLAHKIEQSFMCYTIGLCWLSTLKVAVCMWPTKILKIMIFIIEMKLNFH